eukprot:508533-Rhodomonas_salina.2
MASYAVARRCPVWLVGRYEIMITREKVGSQHAVPAYSGVEAAMCGTKMPCSSEIACAVRCTEIAYAGGPSTVDTDK